MVNDLVVSMAQAAAAEAPHAYQLTAGNVFLLFFIMLGPLKSLGPFYQATHELEPAALRAMAWKVFSLALVAVMVAGLLGKMILTNWHIDPPIMQLAGGLIFLLVALQLVLEQYKEPAGPPAERVTPQLMKLVFPVTATPYGMAALIVIMDLSRDVWRSSVVLGLAVAVMVLNLLAMRFIRPLMRWIGPLPLQMLGAVLGVVQVALALQFMVGSLNGFGIVMKGS